MKPKADKTERKTSAPKNVGHAHTFQARPKPQANGGNGPQPGQPTLQQAADYSAQVQQMKRMQQLADDSPQSIEALQRQAMADAAPHTAGRTKPPMQLKSPISPIPGVSNADGKGVIQAKGAHIPAEVAVRYFPPPPGIEEKNIESKRADSIVRHREELIATINEYHALPDGSFDNLDNYSILLLKLDEMRQRVEPFRNLAESGLFGLLAPSIDDEVKTVRNEAYQAAVAFNAAARFTIFELLNKQYNGRKEEEKKESSEINTAIFNTLQWIFDPASTVKVYVVTRTGDWMLRVLNRDQEAAYFSNDVDFKSPAVATYTKDDITSAAHIEVIDKSYIAYQKDSKLFIPHYTGSKTGNLLFTLVHELQHYADKHKGYDSQAAIKKDIKPDLGLGLARNNILLNAIRIFKTEFRAHTYARQGVGTLAEYLLKEYPTLQAARDTPGVMAALTPIALDYAKNVDSEGFNKFNSININAFYDFIDDIGADKYGMKELKMEDPLREVKKSEASGPEKMNPNAILVMNRVEKLSPKEALYIWKGRQWQGKLQNHFGPLMVEQINLALQKKSGS